MKSKVLAFGVMAATAFTGPAMADKLDDIIAAGTLRCAVVLDFPPMGSRDADNNPVGFDVDYCNDLAAALAAITEIEGAPPRVFALSTRSRKRFDQVDYRRGDAFLFGSETAGLPQDVFESIPEAQCLRLPMRPDNRSLNLSNAVAVMVFEAWRQASFDGGA